MPSYTENSSIFGSIMINRTFSGVALYNRLSTIAFRATDLPEPVVPAIRRCGILAKIGEHRLTADVLAERERERRLQLVVRLGLHDLAERHDLANLVRDLEPNVRLARNDLDDAHAHRRERAREVFREVADLAAFHSGRRLELEPRDDGARVHRHDLGLDAEVVELDLDQPRHRFERLGGIAALAQRRIVEQRQATAARWRQPARTTAPGARVLAHARPARSPRPSRSSARCAAR